MDPKLEHLVNCIQALELQRKLTPELSGRVLDASCVEPQSHLVGAFQDCVLLYNDFFMSTWTVDEEYLKQLERIIRPWSTFVMQSHGYHLFSRAAVKEFGSRCSLGPLHRLPLSITNLLELEHMTVNPEFIVGNYLGVFEALRFELG